MFRLKPQLFNIGRHKIVEPQELLFSLFSVIAIFEQSLWIEISLGINSSWYPRLQTRNGPLLPFEIEQGRKNCTKAVYSAEWSKRYR